MNLYLYRATVVRWVDGDTLIADWDLGDRIVRHGETFRLHGINTPELRPRKADFDSEAERQLEKSAGLAARTAAELLAPPGTAVIIETIQDRTGKFGRYLVKVFVGSLNVNAELVDKGHAEVVDYD